MNRTRLFALVTAAMVVVAISYVGRGSSNETTEAPLAAAASSVDEVELDRLISLFADRASNRGESIEYRTAGGLLLQRAELNASVVDFSAAFGAFAAAAEKAPEHPEGLLGLGRAALGIHDFTTAREAAGDLLASHGDSPDALALAGDAAFAVGDYDEAAAAYTALAEHVTDDPAVLVRRAQLALIESGPEEARRLADEAVTLASRLRLPASEIAFYESFAGNLAFQRGDHADALHLLERAVAHAPADHGALGELARLEAAAGDVARAIELLEEANDLVPEPDHLVLLGDLRVLAGDRGAAVADYERAVAIATLTPDHERAWARALAAYLLEHDGDLDWAHDIARREVEDRRDAGAWDLLAWSHYRRGELPEARRAIDTALAVGEPNAATLYHAGVISLAEGNRVRAATELAGALDLNPGFDPLPAAHAVSLLAQLR